MDISLIVDFLLKKEKDLTEDIKKRKENDMWSHGQLELIEETLNFINNIKDVQFEKQENN